MAQLINAYRAGLGLGLAVLTFLVLFRLWQIILLVIVSLIFMGALLPPVDWLARRGLRRGWAVLLVLFAVLAVVLAIIGLTVPDLVGQFQSIGQDLPRYAGELERDLAARGVDVSLEQRARSFDWQKLAFGSAGTLLKVLGLLLSAMTVVVVTAYLLVDAPRLKRTVDRFVPAERREETDKFLHDLRGVVGGYVRGQLITSAAITVFTFVLLLVLGVRDPLAYAVLAGFFDVIPIVGAFLAVAPATLAAYQESTQTAAIALGAMVLYQQFEDRLLVPRLYGHILKVPALAIFLGTLAGAQLLGIVGALLALPFVAALNLVFERWSRLHSGSSLNSNS